MFDSDTTFNSDSNANNILDNMINNTIDHSNESDTNMEEYGRIFYILDEDYLKEMNNIQTIHDLDVVNISMK